MWSPNEEREQWYCADSLKTLSQNLDGTALEVLERGREWAGVELVVIAVDRELTSAERNAEERSDHSLNGHPYADYEPNMLTVPELIFFQLFGSIHARDDAALFTQIAIPEGVEVDALIEYLDETADGTDAVARIEIHEEPTGFGVQVITFLLGVGASGGALAATEVLKRAVGAVLDRLGDMRSKEKFSTLYGQLEEVHHKALVEASLVMDVSTFGVREYRYVGQPWVIEYIDRRGGIVRVKVEVDIVAGDVVATVAMVEAD